MYTTIMQDLNDLKDLTAVQRKILECMECERSFTDVFHFTGGTLLKALDIVPRESNDLDFFTFPSVDGRTYLKSLADVKGFLSELFGADDVIVTDRGFLMPQSGMRIECVYDAVHAIDDFIPFGRLKTSGLRDLVANKVAAFCVRDEMRDYIDLAFLTAQKGWKLADLAAIAEEKFSLQTITEEKLLTEFLKKKEMFQHCPPAIFLRDQEENAMKVDQQVELLLKESTL